MQRIASNRTEVRKYATYIDNYLLFRKGPIIWTNYRFFSE